MEAVFLHNSFILGSVDKTEPSDFELVENPKQWEVNEDVSVALNWTDWTLSFLC